MVAASAKLWELGDTGLTQEQIDLYHTEGYLALSGVFSPDRIAELSAVTDQFVEKSREVTESGDVFDVEEGHTAERPRLRRLRHPYQQHEAYNRAMRDERVMRVITQLIGDNVRYQGGKLNIKPPEVGSAFEWHQDWGFFPHTNDDLLAVGIALEDVLLENGCLMVVPRTHKDPIYDHAQDGVFVGAVDPTGLDDVAVPLVLPAGSMSVHHVRLLHGSAPNRSLRSRRLLLFEYAAADAWPLVSQPSWETLQKRVIRGEMTVLPRLENVPVRLPFPREGDKRKSIFELQKTLKRSGFEATTT